MVEFSGYARSDVNHFRSCFPGITGTYAPDAIVGGPNPDTSGKGEVALDLEVAMAAAPDAELRAYIAPNDPNFAPALFDQMRQDGVNIISDSWGACEPLITPGLLTAENTSLELAAVAGISTFVATGDFGSTDCFPFTGSDRPVRRRPLLTAVRDRRRRHDASRRRPCTAGTARPPGTDPAAASRCTGPSPPTSAA